MSDTPQTEPTVETPAVEENVGTQPEVPAFLRDIDPAKRAEILAKLAAHKAERAAVPTPEEVAEGNVESSGPEVLEGKNIAWENYELPYSVKHLYKEARYQDTPQGPKWVALVDEFDSSSRDYDGKNSERLKDGSSRHLATFLGDMLNSPEGWKLISILPTGNRAGVVFQRAVPVLLPDPKPLKMETQVEAPKDEELQATQAAADAFAAEVGGSDVVSTEVQQ